MASDSAVGPRAGRELARGRAGLFWASTCAATNSSTVFGDNAAILDKVPIILRTAARFRRGFADVVVAWQSLQLQMPDGFLKRFAQLDAALTAAPTVWVLGPASSGKSSLIQLTAAQVCFRHAWLFHQN